MSGTASPVLISITQEAAAVVCNSVFAQAAVPGSTTVAAAGTSSPVQIDVTTAGATCSWSAVSDSAWLALAGASGTGASGSFTFVASENLSATSRTGTITFSSGSATPVAVTVTQQGHSNCASAETVDPATASVTADAGSGTVAITTPSGTCAWEATVTSGGEWLSITSGGSGIGDGTIAYAYTANAGSERVGVITLTGGGTLTVTQTGGGSGVAAVARDAASQVIPPHDEDGFRYHIFLGSGTLEVTNSGEVEILVVGGGGGGGGSATAGSGGSGGGGAGSTSGAATSGSANTGGGGGGARVGNGGDGGAGIVIVRYPLSPPTSGLVVLPDSTLVPAPGTVMPVDVTVLSGAGTPTQWSAASSEPWLAIAHSATGSADAFGFTAAPNLGMLPRTAVVTVTAADGQTASFEVRQQAPCEHVGGGDCDSDGISDLCAIAWGLDDDRNANGIPDACEAGTTVTVPGDFATLQAALDAAVDGWAIRLDPGTYAGPIVIAERSVTLEAAGPLGSVVFDGTSHPGPVVTIVDDPSRGSLLPTTLRGIVVTGGSEGTPVERDGATYAAGGGVLVVGAALSIESGLITANHAGHGGGIAVISSLLSIASSEIAGNTADLAGGGIALIASEAIVDGVTIHGNAAPLGAGLWLDASSTAQVSASTVCDNQPDQIAGAWQDLGGNAPCSCIGDLNGDGTIDGFDLAAILAAWGQTASPRDLDGDGIVGGSDLAAVLAAWGACP